MKDKTIAENFIELYEKTKSYLNLRLEYYKIFLGEKFIEVLSGVVIKLVFICLLFFVLMFGAFGFAYWMGDLINSLPLAFLIVAGIYFLIGIIIFLFRKPLIMNPLVKKWVKIVEIENENKEDEEI